MAAQPGSGSRFSEMGARILRTRLLMRAPIWIYRAGAGRVFGSRLLLLEHTGRKSGIRRNVVLEVVGHVVPNRYLVVSGFGEQAQWFRNIVANPRVRISSGRHASAPAIARVVTQQEADRALASYVDRHPRAWKRFRPVLEQTLGAPISTTNTPLPIVELQLS